MTSNVGHIATAIGAQMGPPDKGGLRSPGCRLSSVQRQPETRYHRKPNTSKAAAHPGAPANSSSRLGWATRLAGSGTERTGEKWASFPKDQFRFERDPPQKTVWVAEGSATRSDCNFLRQQLHGFRRIRPRSGGIRGMGVETRGSRRCRGRRLAAPCRRRETPGSGSKRRDNRIVELD